MKNLFNFSKKSRRLYLTLVLGLGFSLPQRAISNIVPKSIKLPIYEQQYFGNIRKSPKLGLIIQNVSKLKQTKNDKPLIKKAKVIKIKPESKIINSGNKNYHYQELKLMEATAYYPGPECTGKYSDGKTYTGKKARYGIVAVDPKVIPLGTKLYIEGYGQAEAADIGGAIKGNKIDLCYNTYKEAKQFGRKKIKVYLLK